MTALQKTDLRDSQSEGVLTASGVAEAALQLRPTLACLPVSQEVHVGPLLGGGLSSPWA